jgi:hypothetical protein
MNGHLIQLIGRLAAALLAIWFADREARQLDGTYRPASRRRRIVSWAIVLGVMAALVWWSRTHP